MIQPEYGGGITFTRADGRKTLYTATDELPELVRVRLTQMPVVIKHLMDHNTKVMTSPMMNQIHCTPVNRKLKQQSPHTMRFFR